MRKVIRKLFWAWDFDKEEKWLNEMSSMGLALVSVGHCKYTFEECVPSEYSIRLELLEDLPTHAQSQQYIKFIEETHAEYLGSIMRWVYFRKKTESGKFRLHSDNASRIKHLKRLLTMIGIVCFINILNGFVFSSIMHSGTVSNDNFFISILCFVLGFFLLFGFLRIYFKRQQLKKEQGLFE